jgi:hypothetical protein
MNKLMRTDVAAGSLTDTANKLGISVQEAFMAAEVVVYLDVSGSMDDNDTADFRSRHDVAEEKLREIQAAHPGKVALVCFSDDVVFCPDGVPVRLDRSTMLDVALEWGKIAGSIPDMKIVVVSDGYPDRPERALDIARKYYKHGIYTEYIGSSGDRQGQEFLRELARVTGGGSWVAPKPGELGAGVIALLTGGD